jgi:hypothetical protein
MYRANVLTCKRENPHIRVCRFLWMMLFVIIGCLFFGGCQSNITYEVACHELIGKYTADSGEYPDVIEIYKDGTYSHIYHLYPQESGIKTENKWSCEIKSGKTLITFNDFVFGTDFNVNTEEFRERPRFWVTVVDRYKEKIRIHLPHDFFSHYVKE